MTEDTYKLLVNFSLNLPRLPVRVDVVNELTVPYNAAKDETLNALTYCISVMIEEARRLLVNNSLNMPLFTEMLETIAVLRLP